MDDAEEQAQADEEAEAAAAEALVETTLEMVDAKKCGLCYEWFEAEQMRWDAEPYCYVCKDDEACTARRPGVEPWPDTWTLVSIDTRTPSTRPTLVSN